MAITLFKPKTVNGRVLAELPERVREAKPEWDAGAQKEAVRAIKEVVEVIAKRHHGGDSGKFADIAIGFVKEAQTLDEIQEAMKMALNVEKTNSPPHDCVEKLTRLCKEQPHLGHAAAGVASKIFDMEKLIKTIHELKSAGLGVEYDDSVVKIIKYGTHVGNSVSNETLEKIRWAVNSPELLGELLQMAVWMLWDTETNPSKVIGVTAGIAERHPELAIEMVRDIKMTVLGGECLDWEYLPYWPNQGKFGDPARDFEPFVLGAAYALKKLRERGERLEELKKAQQND